MSVSRTQILAVNVKTKNAVTTLTSTYLFKKRTRYRTFMPYRVQSHYQYTRVTSAPRNAESALCSALRTVESFQDLQQTLDFSQRVFAISDHDHHLRVLAADGGRQDVAGEFVRNLQRDVEFDTAAGDFDERVVQFAIVESRLVGIGFIRGDVVLREMKGGSMEPAMNVDRNPLGARMV